MNRKKHLTNWFTTSSFRAINLLLVTDVTLFKEHNVITGAVVYQSLHDGHRQNQISINAEDAVRLFDLLV